MSGWSEDREWLEGDGLGGFASGTETGRRTRRYHALLLVATTPPTGRVVLVNGLEMWATTPAGRVALSSQRYVPDVIHPDGADRLVRFDTEPWPTWTWRLEDGTRIVEELFVTHDRPSVVVRWRRVEGAGPLTIEVRPLLSGRDYHALHHENPSFDFAARRDGARVAWHPYADLPAVNCDSTGEYLHAPEWYRQFSYVAERARGLDHVEDLASPGVLRFDLAAGDAVMVLEAESTESAPSSPRAVAAAAGAAADAELRRRAAFPDALRRAGDQYVVRRGAGRTVVAGYPWFTDWGRDTFIAMRGLLIAAGRLDEATDILREWAGAVSEGMLPNRFPDRGEAPEFNAVDAALWFVVVAAELRDALAARGTPLAQDDWTRLCGAIDAILTGYASGTRFGIRADADGLIACGAHDSQLTWMDARVNGRAITPRIGKPVEVQALWVNALHVGAEWSETWRALEAKARDAFAARFWNAQTGGLFDVVDVDHVPGTADGAVRPNQIFAVGGLRLTLLEGGRARSVVALVERELLTPLGLRTLAPGSPGYRGRFSGSVEWRDGAYHQGTAWPWLAGPFVEAWVRVHGGGPEVIEAARSRFLEPLRRHLGSAGLGHVSEVADGDAPHEPGGCPFQAWSLGELLRIEALLR